MTHTASPHRGQGRRWLLPQPVAGPRPAALHPVVVEILARRGLAGEAADACLAATSLSDDPFALAGMAAAVRRVEAAIRSGELIAVYGDYDVDGVSATALLMETIWSLGGEARPFLPHRERDGYGVNARALHTLADEGVGLVITVDCGVRDAEALDQAAGRGMDVIVTDHHVLPDSLPRVVAVINPHRADCTYGFDGLAGVGLAHKLAQGLLDAVSRRAGPGARSAAGQLDSTLDLVALGTVADVVPLVDENRTLVRRGLERMRRGRRPGLNALVEVADVDRARISARDIAWSLAPRLNAAGRIDHAQPALELLVTRDRRRAEALAHDLSARNRRRRALTQAAVQEAEDDLATVERPHFIVLESSRAPLGVLGLVASRLAERYYRPAAVVRRQGDMATGSVRSIPEFHVASALDRAGDLLVRHGGHAMAAGFTVESTRLDELAARLEAIAAEALAGLDLRPQLAVDAVVSPRDLDWALSEALDVLEPFGEGNPRPLLLVRGTRAIEARLVGEEKSHLSFRVPGPGDEPLKAIAFRQGRHLDALGDRVDIVASLEVDSWRGNRTLQLVVHDLAPAGEKQPEDVAPGTRPGEPARMPVPVGAPAGAGHAGSPG